MPTLKASMLAPLWALLALPGQAACAQEGEAGAGASFQDKLAADGLQGCSVSAPPLVFSVPLGTNGPFRSTTSVMVACTPRVDFAVGIDRGDNALGVNRRMRNTATRDFIRYDIYSDPSHRREWSNHKNQMVAGNSGASGRTTLTAYGEVKNLGGSVSGSYADTVTVTIEF
jgi:spore coat protein U-like protein